MKIRDARSLPFVAREDIRQEVLGAVLDGRKQVEVAEVFDVTRHAGGKWVLGRKRREKPKVVC